MCSGVATARAQTHAGVRAGVAAAADREIFLVPHADEVIVHAPLHGISSLLDRRAAQLLAAALHDPSAARLPEALQPLAERLLQDPCPPPRAATGAFVPRQLGLLPTIDCNLACRYCGIDAGAVSLPPMSTDICDAALALHAEVVRRHRLRSLSVYLFGGEPFSAMEVVRHADSRGRELAAALGVPYRSTCTTNGFLCERDARWVAEHLSYVVVSLDGPAEIHDRNRPGRGGGSSHRRVMQTLQVLAEQGLPYALRCTVDEETVVLLPSTIDFLCRELRPTLINVEPVAPAGRCGAGGAAAPQPRALVAAVVAAGRVARRFGIGLKLSVVQSERLLRSYCGTADDNLVVTPDGLLSSCYHVNHRGSPLAADFGFGEIDPSTGSVHIDEQRLAAQRRRGVEAIDRCNGCFARWHCAGGCVLQHPANHAGSGERCRTIRALTRWRLLERMRLFDRADQVSIDDEPDPLPWRAAATSATAAVPAGGCP